MSLQVEQRALLLGTPRSCGTGAAHLLECLPPGWTLTTGSNATEISEPYGLVIASFGDSPPLHKWLGNAVCPILGLLERDCSDEALRSALQEADDVVLLPARGEEIRCRISRLIGRWTDDTNSIVEQLSAELAFTELVGRDPVFLGVLSQLQRMSRSDAPILIKGETGTGKEMCARAIHHLSRRQNLPFIPVDCGAIPAELFENEVFGHVRGAFTDAQHEQKGLVAMADGGTLFLDEVDMLPMPVQSKLLRFSQEHTYKPLGCGRFMQSEVRIIAATNRDLDALTATGQFRSDLYYRLNVLRLDLPPLRRRPADIEILARHFTRSLCNESGNARMLSRAAIRKLQAYDWPGNVRELYNVIHRAVVSADGTEILPAHIATADPEPAAEAHGEFRTSRARAIETFERAYVEHMLEKHHGNVTRAAKEAGKERRAFGRLVKKYIQRDGIAPVGRVVLDPPA